MQEKWNQFVYDLCEAKKRDVDEDIYHSLHYCPRKSVNNLESDIL